MRHHNLSTQERENLLIVINLGKSIRKIADELGRLPSTISRALKRNRDRQGHYSSAAAQRKYVQRQKTSGCQLLLREQSLYDELVRHLFLDLQWLPEQISCRLKYENCPDRISYGCR